MIKLPRTGARVGVVWPGIGICVGPRFGATVFGNKGAGVGMVTGLSKLQTSLWQQKSLGSVSMWQLGGTAGYEGHLQHIWICYWFDILNDIRIY